MNTTLTVRIVGPRTPLGVSVSINISENMIYKAFEVLDFPDPDADIITKEVFCSGESRINHVTEIRKDAANNLADLLSKELIKIMGSADTRMGYRD